MLERQIVIINRLGLHARAAARLVKLTTTFKSDIKIARIDMPANIVSANSIFSILLLAASQGTTLNVIIDGVDEAQAMDAVTRLIESKFGEE